MKALITGGAGFTPWDGAAIQTEGGYPTGLIGSHPTQMYYVYVIESTKDGLWYTGSTADLARRLKEHNEGKVSSTSHRGPFELIYFEACINEHDARVREQYLKTAWGKRYLKNRLKTFLMRPAYSTGEVR